MAIPTNFLPKVPTPTERIFVEPETPQEKSAAEQAKLNSADWIAKYRAMTKNVTPRVDQLSMQDQISTAMKDPVYGQATATGLSSGQNMLNSWIAGINAKSRMDERNLENERWIKQLEDADEDKNYRRGQDDKRFNEQVRQFNESLKEQRETRKENRADRLRLEAEANNRWNKQFDYNKLQDEKRETGWVPEAIPDGLYFVNDPNIKNEYKQLMQDPSLKRQMYRTLDERDRIETRREGVLAKLAKIRESAPRSMLPDMTEFDRQVASGQYKNRSGRLLDRGPIDAKWLGGLMDWEGQVSNLVKSNTGDGRIRTFANPMQYTNLLRMFGMENEARDFEKIITQNLRDIGRIRGLAIGNSPVSPMYIRTDRGLGVVDPITGKVQFLNQTVTDTDGK